MKNFYKHRRRGAYFLSDNVVKEFINQRGLLFRGMRRTSNLFRVQWEKLTDVRPWRPRRRKKRLHRPGAVLKMMETAHRPRFWRAKGLYLKGAFMNSLKRTWKNFQYSPVTASMVPKATNRNNVIKFPRQRPGAVAYQIFRFAWPFHYQFDLPRGGQHHASMGTTPCHGPEPSVL